MAYENNWRLYDDVLDCLESLKKHTLGIISNGDFKQQVYKLEKTNIRDYFKIIVTAGDTHVAKPNPEIFRIACEMAGTVPEYAAYIGDDLKTDILPCEKAGINGIWLKRLNGGMERAGIKTIYSLSELPGLLEVYNINPGGNIDGK